MDVFEVYGPSHYDAHADNPIGLCPVYGAPPAKNIHTHKDLVDMQQSAKLCVFISSRVTFLAYLVLLRRQGMKWNSENAAVNKPLSTSGSGSL